jgi:N-acetylglucosamine kinase-like BadF-type ATPase
MGSLVLGVDVGNSKTHVAVVDDTGAVVGAATGTGWVTGDLRSSTVVEHVLDVAEQACGYRTGFAAAAFAMAGLDLPAHDDEMTGRVAATGVSDRLTVVNDTFALLRAGSASGEGIAVVAGAGFNCVGVRGPDVVRFHSMGRITGDWGGGYDVGAEALFVACRAEDGRGPVTVLQQRVPAHFGRTRPLELSEEILAGRLRQDRLLELCPVVFAAAAEGDAPARQIVDRLAVEVTAFVRATLRRLGTDGLPVVLGGGLLQARDPLLMAGVEAALADTRVELRVCDAPPVVGAVAQALDLLDVPADLPALASALEPLLAR